MKAAMPLIVLALAGCTTVSSAEPGPTVALGQLARTNGLRLRPLEIVEDSRCPARVRCVWAGRVRVLTLIELRGGSEELRTTLTLGERLPVADGSLTLVAVAPQKIAPGDINARSYRLTFDFQGGL
jgi:hypothetical protein